MVFDERSHLGAFRLHMWHRYRIWLMIRTFISIGLLLAGVILLMSHGPDPLAVLMLMIGTFALLRPLMWKIMHGRNLRKLPGYGQTVVYTFTSEAIEINGEDRQATVSWSGLFEAVVTKKGLILYHSKKSYTWVPCEAFDSPEDFTQASDWVKEK